jgi:hypothetical protein
MTDPLDRLSLVQSQIECLGEELSRLVAESRAAGASWAAIAQRLGTSRQAAQQRFGPRPKSIEDLPLSDPLFDPLFLPPKD